MSILANVQKQAMYSGLETMVGMVTQLGQLQAGSGRSPDVLDKIDCDEIVDQLADMYILPAGIVLGDDAVEQKCAERQEAEMQAQQYQQAMAEAQGASQAAPQISRAVRRCIHK